MPLLLFIPTMFSVLSVCLAISHDLHAAEPACEKNPSVPAKSNENAAEKFVSLFNGRDLAGWEQVNCDKETFTARDGMIVSTGKPTGVLRTDKQYENFILELEWKHLKPKGNAGLFVWSDALTARGVPFTRSIEVQILDGHETPNYTSHGDIFSIHGATLTPDRPHPNGWARCLPSEQRCKPAGEWNHYRVECRDGAIKLAVNGKEVSGGYNCSPRKGYICLESEGSECHFRNIRIAELPGGKATPEQTATVARGFRPLYYGLNFDGWRYDKYKHQGGWHARDWILALDRGRDLWTEEEFEDIELIVDWRLTGKPVPVNRVVIDPSGADAKNPDGTPKVERVLSAGESGIALRGLREAMVYIWCGPAGSGEIWGYRNDVDRPLSVRAACTPKEKADEPLGKWNRFHITLIGNTVSVVLNGKTVIDNAELPTTDAQHPGLPARGPIGLIEQSAPVEFANLFVRPLPRNEE